MAADVHARFADGVFSPCRTTAGLINVKKKPKRTRALEGELLNLGYLKFYEVVGLLPRTLLVLLVILELLAASGGVNADSDPSCDWTGSGLNQPPDERGVQPVYVHCSQGTIRWSYPQGALHLVMRLGSGRRDFKGCIRASKTFKGARIYVEGRRQLHPLLSPSDGRPLELPRCFDSQGGQVALYVESDTPSAIDTHVKMAAEFTYDLQLVSPRTYRDPLEECRPCSTEEMLHLYCISDFVVRGTINSVEDDHPMERTEVRVRAKRVIRDTSNPVFVETGKPGDPIHGHYSTLHMPVKCGARHGKGDFLFMGRMVLGTPHVWCAPRTEDWDHIRQIADRQGTNQCTLE